VGEGGHRQQLEHDRGTEPAGVDIGEAVADLAPRSRAGDERDHDDRADERGRGGPVMRTSGGHASRNGLTVAVVPICTSSWCDIRHHVRFDGASVADQSVRREVPAVATLPMPGVASTCASG